MNKQLVFILLTIMLLLVGCGKTETTKEKVESAKTTDKTTEKTTEKSTEKPAEQPVATPEQKPAATPKTETPAAPVETAPADELVEENIVVVEEKAEPEQITTILEESETDFGNVI